MAKQAQLDEVRPVLNKANKAAAKVVRAMDVVEAGADKATDILEEGLEVVADVVPETIDKGVHFAAEGVKSGADALTSARRMAILVGLGGVVAGAAVGVAGYFVLKRKLEKKYMAEFDERLVRETKQMEAFYARRNKGEGFETPMEAAVSMGAPTIAVDESTLVAAAAGEALADYEGDAPPVGIQPEGADPREGKNAKTPYHRIAVSKPTESTTVVEVETTTEPVEGVAVSRNVFDARRIDGWDQEREEAMRDPLLPYIISYEEHNENEFEHEQNTLTYYTTDGMLVDERDQPIEDVEALVGTANLQMFGHGSQSPDSLYIRHEMNEIDLEIIRIHDSFSRIVLGLDE